MAAPKTHSITGFRISLVRQPGVWLAERPLVNTPAAAARVFREFIGESDREQFVIAMLTVRHRVLGLHTVSVAV